MNTDQTSDDPETDPDGTDVQNADDSADGQDGNVQEQETELLLNGKREALSTEQSAWTAEDFTYAEMSHKLYGCDYSREFTVSGLAVSGFSESGLEKVKTNKELVIPAEDPNGTKIMGVTDQAFQNQGLTKLTLPEGAIVPYDDTVTHVVTERGNFLIGASAFANNELTELTLPDGVIAVMTSAFSRNQLTSVSIPHTVWWLENSCFAYNKLTTVGFPITTDFQCEIHAFAFSQNNIRSVRLPDYTMVVEKKTFLFNPGVESVPENAPSGESEMGGVVYMYTDNPNLANMERIHHIDRKSEAQLSWHQKLIIGAKPEVDNVWTEGDFLFDGTAVTGLSESGLKKSQNDKELVIPEKTPDGQTVTRIAGVFQAQGENFRKVILHDGIIEIGEGAFENCAITELTLPARLETIGARAFAGNQLSALRVPGSVKVVSSGAFSQTEGRLAELTFGEGVEEIQAEAFGGSLLETVYLPESLKKLDEAAFKRTGNVKVKLFAYDAEQVSDKANFPDSEYHEIKVNLGDWNEDDFTYKGTTITGLSAQGYLKRQDNRDLVLPDKNPDGDWITEIGAAVINTNGLFGVAEAEDETKTTYTFDTVKLPSHLEKIGNYAFQGNQIKKVNFPETLEEIGSMAFQTNDLEEILLPDSVETIGQAAFTTNPNIKRIKLSAKLTEIPASAFGNAGVISAPYTELEIPAGVTKIGSRAFAGNSLKKLEIPGSVVEIGSSAFANGQDKETLQELILQEGLEEIGSSAFGGARLQKVYLPSTVTKINKNAFKGGTEGVVTLYVDGIEQYELLSKTASTYHIVKLNPGEWNQNDFIYEGTVIKGLSAQGYLKRQDNRDLVLPDKNPDGDWITEIGAAVINTNGLFGMAEAEDETKTTYTFDTVKLPSHLEKIGNYAFQGNQIKKVNFPETLKEIGSMAFQTNDLEEILLPDSVETIGQAAFMTNPNVKRIKLSAKLTEIPASAFGNAGVISAPYTELEIPAGVTKIGSRAFAGNSLKKLEIPGSVVEIGSSAFSNGQDKETLQELILHEGLEKIGSSAFGGSALESIDLPATVKTLNAASFKGNKNGNVIVWSNNKAGQEKFNSQKNNTFIVRFKEDEFTFEAGALTGITGDGLANLEGNTTLVLPSTDLDGNPITEIKAAAPNLGGTFGTVSARSGETYVFEKVVLPSSLERIGNFAFQNNGIKEITFPETLKEIGQNAFHNNHIASVVLPDSVTTLGAAAFLNNPEIAEIRLSPNIKVIPASAFNVTDEGGAASLTSLELPEGVEEIGTSAFATNHIKELRLPDSVKKIGQRAFMQGDTYRSLETLVLSASLESIGKSAFDQCRLTYVALPDGLTELQKTAFAHGEYKVWLYTGNEAHLTETSKFKPTGDNHQVVYEAAMANGWSMDDFTYEGGVLTGWSEKGNVTRKGNLNLVLPTVNPSTGEAITAIADSAFAIPEEEWDQGHTGVESVNGMDTVVIPDTVTHIGNNAFQYNNLVEVDFPEGLTSIGGNAFNSNKLEKVNLPDTVTYMGEGAFSANNITDIRLSRGLTRLENGVFSDNIRLAGVEIPDTITEIGDFAFSGDRIETLSIPKSVTKIGRAAFKLHHLTELRIPGNVKEIGESAFEGTYKAITLKKLILEEGVESIGPLAFRMGYLEQVDLPSSLKTLDVESFKDNTGANDSGVVDLFTTNPDHMKFVFSEYHRIMLGVEWREDCFTYEGTTVTGFSEKGKAYLEYTTEIEIPDKNPQGEYVTEIGAEAFKDMGITKVTLPSQLRKIGEQAFAGNRLLQAELPDTMEAIAANAFEDNGQVVRLLAGSRAVERLKDIDFDGAKLVLQENPGNPQSPAGQGGNGDNGAGQKPGAAGSGNTTGGHGVPQTGDTAPVLPYTLTALMSLMAIAAVLRKRNRAQLR